jgi:hypothetical protein
MYEELASIWRRCSEQLDRLCRADGIVYVHFLQPNQYVPGTKPMGAAEERRAWLASHPYRRGVEEGYPRLISAGRMLVAEGVDFHDLTQLFAGTREPRYVDTCCHLNRAGNAALAHAVAEVLRHRIEAARADAPPGATSRD